MNLSVYDGARWVSITPHAFSHAIGGKDELIPEAIGAASTLFVEDAISTHLDETDPHPQYLTQSEGDTLYVGAGAFSTHVAASDPHPQYLTQSEGDTLYAGAGAISDHVATSDPHPQYLTQSEGDTLYAGAGAISDHVATSDPHPQYLTQSEGDTLYAPNNAIASHLATSNPHLITPTLIGAAPTSHTHTGTQISGNISGNAANITGIAAIANGGTGASTAPAALTNLGAAAASHTHTGAQISGNISGNAANVTGIVAIANGGTGASTVSAARTNLQVAMSSISCTFNTGWSNYGSSWPLQINKFSSLIVITGLVTRTSGTNNTILVLPSSCRPISVIMSICWGYWNSAYYPCRVDFYPNGNVALIYYATGTISSLIDWIQLTVTFVTANP